MNRCSPLAAFLLGSLALAGSAVAQEALPPAPAAKEAPGSLYLTAIAELRRACDLGPEEILSLPEVEGDDCAKWILTGEEWDAHTTKTAGALLLFEQASRQAEAPFGPAEDPLFVGYDATTFPLWSLAMLTAAHGRQRLAAKEPGEALQDAITLLRHSRHVAAQPSSRAALFAGMAEVLGLALLRDALAVGAGLAPGLLERNATELGDHARLRPGRQGTAASITREVQRMMQGTIDKANHADAKVAIDAETRLLRERGREIAAQVNATTARWVTPLQADASTDFAVVQAEVAKVLAEARAAARIVGSRRELMSKFAKMTPEQAVEALANMFASMLVPNLAPLVSIDAEARQLLAECSRALAKLRGPLPTGTGK